MVKNSLILVGGGGHCKSCIDVIERTGKWDIKGILDEKKIGGHILNYPIIGSDNDFEKFAGDHYFLITVGQVKSADVRKKIAEKLAAKGARLATVVSPFSIISGYAKIGEGTIIHHSCVINAGAAIGRNCIINTHANVEHDAQIGDFTHISTGSTVNGDAVIGSECFIGSGCIISNGVKIIDQVIIGAAGLVVNNIETHGTYVGAPCRRA